MNQYLGSRKKKGRLGKIVGILGGLAAVAAAGFGGVVTFRSGETPELAVTAGRPAIGRGTKFELVAKESVRGLAAVRVEVRQGERVFEVVDETIDAAEPWQLDAKTVERKIEFVVGKDSLSELVEGEVTIVATAVGVGTWLKDAPTKSTELTSTVRLRPPRLQVLSDNIFPAQGGCEVVVYTVGETATRHGVEAGGWFFPGYPLPGGGAREHFAYFAIPYDMAEVSDVRLVASDEVQNESKQSFIDRFTPRPFATDTIRVSGRVMERVVSKIMSQVPSFEDTGDLVANYVSINSNMRKDNNDLLVELSKGTKAEMMWNRSFVQMRAKAVSQFADRRTYYHKEKKIDRQDHLGFDLASTRRAPVPSSNAGLVVYADYLGIYGNTVVVDHGYGLMSLYAHLSQISVKVGDRVERAQTVGRTGATGLALGDHLHFTMMLHGLPVTPLEWWDGHWIQDRIALKLGEALGYVGDEEE